MADDVERAIVYALDASGAVPQELQARAAIFMASLGRDARRFAEASRRFAVTQVRP